MGLHSKSCGSVTIGGGSFILANSAQLACGNSILLYEADGRCVTITGNAQVNLPGGFATPCNSFLDFITCDGQVITKELPNPTPGTTAIQTPTFTVACVERLVARCEPVTGGTGCDLTFSYAISYCEEDC